MDSQNNVEYANSIGLSAIIESLQNWSMTRSAPKFDTTIVNMLTLIRNNINKEDSADSISDNVINDINALTYSIYAYTEQHKNELFTPYILYYLPDYSAIPLAHRRKENDTRMKLAQVTDYLRKKIGNRKELITLTTSPIQSYFMFAGNQYVYPHFHVVDEVRKLNANVDKDRVSSLQRKYILMSHCPLDFHMWSKIPFKLFETYTGRLKEYRELGQKVFKVPFIPFNKYTHILFGDSIHIKPMAVRNAKKSFTELATKDKWLALGEEGIKSSILRFDSTAKLFINNLVV